MKLSEVYLWIVLLSRSKNKANQIKLNRRQLLLQLPTFSSPKLRELRELRPYHSKIQSQPSISSTITGSSSKHASSTTIPFRLISNSEGTSAKEMTFMTPKSKVPSWNSVSQNKVSQKTSSWCLCLPTSVTSSWKPRATSWQPSKDAKMWRVPPRYVSTIYLSGSS